jgi:tetratricopeptide (TPR) repeat protein
MTSPPPSPLQPPDSIHLEAAQGWLLLNNPLEAQAELNQIQSRQQQHQEVLGLLYQIHGALNQWDRAHETAQQLVATLPNHPESWIWRSFAARRMTDGGLARALQELLPAAEHFPREPIVPFNLACYTCQLGQLDEARAWLHRAITLGGDEIKQLALQDPDLAPLRPPLGGLEP